jgi:thiol-disulfide isomerase/thioredoxin
MANTHAGFGEWLLLSLVGTMSCFLHPTGARRQLLQSAMLAAAGVVLGRPVQAAPEPAYTVNPWQGPTPALQAVGTTGKTWRLDELKGRAVLINFWASWCEPCRAEMPTLQQIADLYGPDKLVVLALNFKEHPNRAIQFAAMTGLSLPVLLDPQGQNAEAWGVKVFPTTVLIDRQGRARQRVQGEVDWTGAAAAQLVDALLKT